MYYPDLEQLKHYRAQGNLAPIYREVIADLETPVSAFLKIYDGGYSFLLESVEGGQHLARYSFIGTRPYRVLSVDGNTNTDPLPLIEHEMNKYHFVPVPGLPRFCGGAVGYLGYETATHFENLPTPEDDILQMPEALFMFTDTLLVFDHVTHTIKVVSHVKLDGDIEHNYREAVRKIDSLAERIEQALAYKAKERDNSKENPDTEPQSNISREYFIHCVDTIKQYIAAEKPSRLFPRSVCRAPP
jgi:anthranilate synthase component 1